MMKFILLSIVLVFAISLADGQVASNLKFIFYSNNPTAEKVYDISSLSSILLDPKFDKTKSTVFFFYGLFQSADTAEVVKVKNAYLDSGSYNFIIVSISIIYYNALNAQAISKNTAESIQKLVIAGYDLSKLEIVGYDLGAQIGALTARSIPFFPRLTGLDPAFIVYPMNKALSSSDAVFVITIHTEKRSFGDEGSVGHLNGWFNGAEQQPMCLVLTIENRICSHVQALLFWAEAVCTNSATVFPARKCASYSEFKSNGCDITKDGYINSKSPSTMRGNYYLNTFETSPYSKSKADP